MVCFGLVPLGILKHKNISLTLSIADYLCLPFQQVEDYSLTLIVQMLVAILLLQLILFLLDLTNDEGVFVS